MKNYFILCGANRTPYAFWYPWLFEELKKETNDIYCPAMPKMNFLNYKNWSKIIKAYIKIGAINSNTIFICHSTACVFLAKFICRYHFKVKGIVFVSGFNKLNINAKDIDLQKEIVEANRSFIVKEEQICKLEKFCKNIFAFISSNDPMISTSDLEKFAKTTNAKIITIKNGGHFNDERFATFEKLLEIIKLIE